MTPRELESDARLADAACPGDGDKVGALHQLVDLRQIVFASDEGPMPAGKIAAPGFRGSGDRIGARGLGRTGERSDARQRLLPARMRHVSAPAGKIGALNLIERHGQPRRVERQLNQLPLAARPVGFRAHPLALRGLRRPDHHDSLSLAQLLFDDVAIGAMRRQVAVAPHAVAERAQRSAHRPGLCRGRARIRDEDVAQRDKPVADAWRLRRQSIPNSKSH